MEHGTYQRGLVETDKCLTNTNEGLIVDAMNATNVKYSAARCF